MKPETVSTDKSEKIKSNTYGLRFIIQSMSQTESLPDFIRRVMREKSLTFGDIERKSGKTITGGYVSDIIQQKTINPSLAKLKALASGLGVTEEEVMAVARGIKQTESSEYKDSRFAAIAFKYGRAAKKASPMRKAQIDALIGSVLIVC